ncbi:hypothetical protein [Paraliobacillus salinarum]|uniref:hypothetical protein n=1 Tax=Paraliobacillus salinarum TaxID=1158996 RepID=UPI0015F53954|nr:hypothetical protein [Paraliobacillus salinarum]
MKEMFDKPMRFAQILETTIQITKKHFSKLFLIALIFMGPIILLQALGELIGGRGFFVDMNYSQLLDASFETYEDPMLVTSLPEDITMTIITLLALIFYPILSASIILLVKRVKDDEAYTVGELIKKAFTRFWPLLWSTLLLGVIVFGILFIPTMLIITIGITTMFADPLAGIGIIIILLLIGFVGFGLLFTRWSFYLPAVLFDRVAPGLTVSWNLTKGRTWKLFLLYVVFILITLVVNLVFELSGLLLGASVLYGILINIAILLTTLFTTVGGAVMYFDSVTRKDINS